MSRLAKDSLAYTLVFAVGYFVACSITNTSRGTIGSPTTVIPRMLNSAVRGNAIFPTNTGSQPVLASIFGFALAAHPEATISNPSDLGQSFEALCTNWGTTASGSSVPGIHAGFGNSGLVPMLPPKSGVDIGVWNDCTAPLASVGADENGSPTGFPILHSGTINNLVAYGTLVSGSQFRCLDTTNTGTLQDNTFVRPYYDLAHDTVVLGSGTSQLTLACSISIAPGDDVAEIQVQWIKS